MSDTAIVGENIEVIQPNTRSAFTWSVVIAGALAAWAVAFIFISLGSGIGLAISAPYSEPSAAAMTIGGAVCWHFLKPLASASAAILRRGCASATTFADPKLYSAMPRTVS